MESQAVDRSAQKPVRTGPATRAVLFDLGNVLVSFSHDLMVRQVAACLGVSETEVRALFMEGGLLAAYERGRTTTEEMYEQIIQIARRRPSLEELIEAASNIFWPNPEMETIVTELLQRGVPLAVVSNTCPIHIDWITARYPFFRDIPHKVLSYEVGAAKPDRRMYERALSLVGTRPEETLFFDDTPANVIGAARLGIRAHRFESPAQARRILRQLGLLD